MEKNDRGFSGTRGHIVKSKARLDLRHSVFYSAQLTGNSQPAKKLKKLM